MQTNLLLQHIYIKANPWNRIAVLTGTHWYLVDKRSLYEVSTINGMNLTI